MAEEFVQNQSAASVSTSEFDFQQPIYPKTITILIRGQQIFDPEPQPPFTFLWFYEQVKLACIASGRIAKDFVVDQVSVLKQGILSVPHQLNRFTNFPWVVKQEGLVYYRIFRRSVSQIRGIYSTVLTPAWKQLLQNLGQNKPLKVFYLLLVPFTVFVYTRFYYVKHNKRDEISFQGKIVVITGAGSGIGERLSLELVKRGATVVLVGRSLHRLHWVAQNGFNRLEVEHQFKAHHHGMIEEPKTKAEYEAPVSLNEPREKSSSDCRPYMYQIHWIQMDLGDVESIWRGVYKLFDVFSKVDIIVNCAGIRAPPQGLTTYDGLEVNFGVNYVGHFIFTNAVLSYLPLPITTPVKIVNVVCNEAFTSGYFDQHDLQNLQTSFNGKLLKNPYATSKLLLYLFHIELTNRLRNAGPEIFKVYAVNPPKCNTNLFRFFEKSWIEKYFPIVGPKAGVQTILHCLLTPKDYSTGSYFIQCRKKVPPYTSSCKAEQHLASQLWELTQKRTTRLVQKCRQKAEKYFSLADQYGNVKFEDYNFYEEITRDPYLPPPKRDIIENNKKYYNPLYLTEPVMARDVRNLSEKKVMEVWERFYGYYDEDEFNPEEGKRPHRQPLDLFFDEMPRVNETNGWMYNLD